MLRDASHSFDPVLREEQRIADALVSTGRRLAGLGTVAALCLLLVAGGWVVEEMVKYTTMVLVASNMNLTYAADHPAPASEQEVLNIEQARQAIAEHRAQMASMRDRIATEQAVQRRTGYVWGAVMLLTGLIMTLAALAGLMGARRARGWQWGVVVVNALAALCTLGCIVALSKWGGFQPDGFNAGVLARAIFTDTRLNTIWLVRGQAIYALLVAVILIATRRPRHEAA